MAQIIWSELAKEDYWSNIDYLLEEWTSDEAITFINKVESTLKLISKKPKTFRKTGYRSTHAVPVVPQVTLFYRIINPRKIELVRFWNNYQNPEKLKL